MVECRIFGFLLCTVFSAATSKKNDAEEDSPKCDLTPCDRTESIPAGVAAGLVLAGVVIGVLVTSICCILLTRLRIKPSGSFIGGHNNAPKQTSCENPLSGEMALTERNFAVVSLRDSNVYNELSVYNEPKQVPARALDDSNDNYDHTNTPRALPRPPSDHANTYNQTYTPLVDQRGGRDKYYTVELQNATADKHREESGVKDGMTKENSLSGTLVRGEESAGTETADRNDGHVMHDYFVLEKKIKTKQDKDNTSDLVDGEDILKRNERGETADDNNAIQHDYFKLEKNGKEPGDTEGINKKGTTHDGVIEIG